MNPLDATPEILEAREFLRSRILQRAVDECSPLSPLEVDYLDSDHLPNEREIMERFDREFEFQGYIEHVGGLLRRARDQEALTDPLAAAAYQEMTKKLEGSPQDFILFSCAVLGLSNAKPMLAWPWLAAILILCAVVGYYLAKTRGLIP